jgi:hypothetical protein
MVRAKCVKGLVLPDASDTCAVYLRVGYREVFQSGRSESVPARVFGEVIDDDGLTLTAGDFEEAALKQVTTLIESFALSYLRASRAQ